MYLLDKRGQVIYLPKERSKVQYGEYCIIMAIMYYIGNICGQEWSDGIQYIQS